jgi:pSer/pThr/pTyr-binding forkhead associated (FHA) protein
MLCSQCGTQNPEEASFCLACGTHLATGGPRRDQREDSGVARLRAAMDRQAAERMGERPAGPHNYRLVFVHHDGSDGASYVMRGNQIDIGRTEGDLLFEDAYLSPRHARIVTAPTGQVLSDLQSKNGIYIRLRAGAELRNGDLILVGRQVLEFELIPDFERDLRPAVQHNVVQFGTTSRPSWARLRQIGPAGVAHDVFYLSREHVVLGREQGDIVFSDDQFMSRRHAHLSLQGGEVHIEDLGSSNGTFLRLRGDHLLVPGDIMRIGNVLLRFETQ